MDLKQIRPKQGNGRTPYGKTLQKPETPYTRLYLIRHSSPKHEYYDKTGDPDMPLSDKGLKKAGKVARHLAKLGVDVIYSSEFLRAYQTGQALAKQKKIKVEPRLNEIDWQTWKKIKYFNLSEKARRKSFKNFKKFDRELDRKQAHVRETLDDIVKKNRGKRIALFTHGNFIRAAITGILDADIIGFLSLEIYQASITEIVVDKNSDAKINYINAICHLPYPIKEDLFANNS